MIKIHTKKAVLPSVRSTPVDGNGQKTGSVCLFRTFEVRLRQKEPVLCSYSAFPAI